MGLDLSFLNWDLLTKFILKGFAFSVQLTVVATLGGIALGTVLALMRLSGRKWLALPQTPAWMKRPTKRKSLLKATRSPKGRSPASGPRSGCPAPWR